MKYLFWSSTAMILICCGTTSNNSASPDNFEQLFSGNMKIVDLTYSISNSNPFWPNSDNKSPFKYTALATHPSGAASMGSYQSAEHFGTHLDAPIHFKDDMPSVDEIDVRDFFTPLAIIDVREKCHADPDYQLSKSDILSWEDKNGQLPEGVVVMMYTGWGQKWRDMQAYRNQDEEGKMHFPGFSVEVNQFLVDERNIKGIGIDDLSVDYGLSKDFAAHGITNGAGKYHLENVANLDLLPASGAYLIVAPIKLEGGSGGQVRLFALIP